MNITNRPFDYDPDKKIVTIHGVPIHVKSDEECAKADASVHVRVADAPVKADKTAVKIPCHRCGELIWLADSTPKNLKHYCIQCIIAQTRDEHTEVE